MKFKLLLATLLLFGAAPATFAQTGSRTLYTTASGGITGDTLGSSSTFTYDLNALVLPGVGGGNAQDFTRLWRYSITVVADSLSGATAGTISLQVSDAPATAGSNVDWVTTSTGTINGTGQTLYYFTDTLAARRIRLRITSPSGSQSTALRIRATFKDETQR